MSSIRGIFIHINAWVSKVAHPTPRARTVALVPEFPPVTQTPAQVQQAKAVERNMFDRNGQPVARDLGIPCKHSDCGKLRQA